jgi:hypothetical protein
MQKNNSAHDKHIRYLISNKKANKFLHYVSLEEALIISGLDTFEVKNDN